VGKAGGNMFAVILPGGFHALCWDPSQEPVLSSSGKSLNIATAGPPTMVFPAETANVTIFRGNPNRDEDVARIKAEKEAEKAAKAS